MPLEEASDLIKKAQIGFRQDAGLSQYNQTLKSHPTVEKSVFELESSSHCFKCMHCKGKLLRGSHSMICVYCGHCQACDLPPQPILFNSTTSYGLLLQSLDLIDSQRIGNFFEENRRNKGGTPVAEGKALGELLDVKIEWRDEIQIPESGCSFLNASEEEQSVSGTNDQSDCFGDDGNHIDEPLEVSTIPSGPIGHDTLAYSASSTAENEAVRSSVTENSLSGDDTLLLSLNEDSKTASVSSHLSNDSSFGNEDEDVSKTSDLKKDSLSEDVKEIEPPKLSSGNEDSKAASVSLEFSSNSSIELDSEIQSGKSTTQDEDSKTTTESSDLLHHSSSGKDEDIQSVKTLNGVVSSNLRDPSSSGCDSEIQSMTQDEDFKTDLSRNSSYGDDTEIQSAAGVTTPNEDYKTDVLFSDKKVHLSPGHDENIQSVTSNKGSNISDVSSDSNDPSSSGGDPLIQFVRIDNETSKNDQSSAFGDQDNPSLLQNEVSVKSSDLIDNSLSVCDAVAQSIRIHNEVSKNDQSDVSEAQDNDNLLQKDAPPEISSKSSSEHDAGIQDRNSDLSTDSLFGNDTDISPVKSVNFGKENEHSKQHATLSSDISRNSSSIDDAKGPIESYKVVVISSDLSRDSSSKDKSCVASSDFSRESSFGDDAKIQSVNSNKDYKIDGVSYDIRRDSFSSRDDAKIPSVDSTRSQNKDSKISSGVSSDFSSSSEDKAKNPFAKIVGVSSDFTRDSSSGDDVKISFENSKSKENEDFKTTNTTTSGFSDLRNSPSGDDASDEFVNLQNNDSKTVDLHRESFSGDDEENQSINSRMQNEDSETATVFSHMRRSNSSSTDYADSKSTAASVDLRQDSSSADNLETLSRTPIIDADIDSISRVMMKEKTNNNLDPVQDDDHPIHKD